ncbi:MAG: hypothetical protein AB8G99_24690 [Planctomycetaceae bacterium]
MNVAANLMMLGGVLLVSASLISTETDADPEQLPAVSSFARTVAEIVRSEPLQTRQLLYGKFKAFANWVASTKQVTNTAQVDSVYSSARLGVSVPALGSVIQAEAQRRELLKPVPLDDARNDWVAFLEELAMGCRWAEELEATEGGPPNG